MDAKKHSAAWAAILAAIRQRISESGQSQSSVARLLGRDRGTVHNWLSGKRGGVKASMDDMLFYMEKLGLDHSRYFGGEGAPGEEEYFKVPWLEATASMGGGSVETSRSVTAHLAFRADWLRAKGQTKGMVIVNASGDSMSPTIPDRAVVLVNERDTSPANNGIFFVCHGEEIFLKRLRVDKSGRVTHLVSDNSGHAMPLDPAAYFEIIGRAIWYGKEL